MVCEMSGSPMGSIFPTPRRLIGGVGIASLGRGSMMLGAASMGLLIIAAMLAACFFLDLLPL